MSDTTTMTVGEAILASAGFEKTAASFYQGLQKGFAYLPQVAALWASMAAEELEHEEIVKQVYAVLSPAELAEPASEDFSRGIESVQKMILLTIDYPIKHLEDAYSLACQLEFSEVNAILKLVVTQIAPRERFKGLDLSELDQHRNQLLELGPQFGDQTWRQAQRFQP